MLSRSRSHSRTARVGRWCVGVLGGAALAGSFTLACSKTPPPPAIVTTPDAAPPGADAGTTFAVQQLGGDAPDGGCASAGMQSAIAVSGSKVAFGRISGVVNNPRIMQLALRFDF